MAANHSYERLPALQESQDIAEYVDIAWRPSEEYDSHTTLRHPPSNSSLPSYTAIEQRDTTDRTSLNSFGTNTTGSSSSSSFEKFKNGWEKGLNRIRRKPVPRYLQGSIRRHPAADIEPTRIGRGVWKDQLLVDRSIRGMALLTTLFALTMLIVVCVNAKDFGQRVNKYTSSIGGATKDCKEVTHTNTALLLLINVAATMILGMSNTYQQLVTSLKVGDVKHMLEKFGDSRVGTNSPFNIQHKMGRKRWSWAAWILLVFTSVPIHFLANSLIGPSYILEPPKTVEFNETSYADLYYMRYSYNDDYIWNSGSFVCWSAFRTGHAHLAETTKVLQEDSSGGGGLGSANKGSVYGKMVVNYARENCSGLANSMSDVKGLEYTYHSKYGYDISYYDGKDGECGVGDTVYCTLHDPKPSQCRLNIRMNAAFILMGALVIKAIYMVAVNVRARGHFKRQLLTFGDVIVASASSQELRVQGECMVNANEAYRRKNTHTCHKHCKNKEESKTGDDLGHCQKCKKWNSTNKFSNDAQPTIATKIKRSLISNLGNTALTQMCIMMLCSIVLVGVSIAVAVPLGVSYDSTKKECAEYLDSSYGYSFNEAICHMSKTQQFEKLSGGFGGFNRSLPIATLPPDKLANEIVSFCISNGAQFIYSLLYLLMIYNITLVSQERDWGRLEHKRKRLRCTTVKGESFEQDYLLQLPKWILFPVMAYSVLTHWMLGEALQTQEAIWLEDSQDIGRHVEHSMYIITYAAYPLWIATFLILLMTGVCWWAFTYKREGFIPQMFGSIRVLCAATTQLDDFPSTGVKWGDLGMGKQFRHAGLSAEETMKINPNELYAGTGEGEQLNQEMDVAHEKEPLLRGRNAEMAGAGTR